MTLADAKLLTLIEDVIGLTDLDEFRQGLLYALQRMVPSDSVSLNDLGPDDITVIAIPPPDPVRLKAFARHHHQNPLAAYHTRTRDGRAYRLSDVITRRELHQLDLYREVYAPLGIEYQIAFTLPTGANRLLGVALSRTTRDYTDTERDLLNRARPPLIQTLRNALDLHRLRSLLGERQDGRTITQALIGAGLTQREAQIVALTAHGLSPRDIAAELSISHRTVAKHLEHSYLKLGVNSQSAVARKAWELTDACW